MHADPANRAAGRPELRRWQLWAEAVLALTLLSLVVTEIWVFGDVGLGVGGAVVATVVAVLVAGPIAFRSTHPWPAFLVNAGATLVLISLGYASAFYQWANLFLLFTIAVVGTARQAWIALGLGLLGVFYYFVSFAEEGLQTGIAVVALWLVLWLVGRVTGAREERERLRSDRDIAATLAATRQERLDLEAQRTTMAREIHDLVGHTVNVMVVHAGAGRRAVRSDPDGAEQAFATIETTGRAALDELDRVLGLLRSGGVDDGTTPYTPLPGLPETSALLTDFRRAGLSVTMTTEGPVEQVPHSIGLTAYRVVQESLTNAMKHSDATSATVRLAVDDESVVIEVVDPGPAKRPRERVADDGQRSGRGLAGIAERVQLHGGHAEVGPIDGGGFRVICAFPMARSGA